VRFAVAFGLFALLIFGGMALILFLLTQLLGGDSRAAAMVWLSTCSLLILLPLTVAWLGRRMFRNIAKPLSELMDAADRVAAGDLSARAPVQRRGEFARLADSFNHMVEEIELADQRRRNLTADVAHELRTPLQIIQGNLEGILDGVYAPTPEHLSATLDETRQLARLVEDLRVLSQAEARQLPIHWEDVDVADLLNDVATSFNGQAQTTNIVLNVETPPDERLVIEADYGRLDQVMGNLVSNALRHTPAGGTVTLRSQAAGDYVCIEVIDTGEGIAAADLPFVFDRFWKADPARTHSQSGGSGLGLAIARQLVQAQGGQISVVSETGAGATFTLEMPRKMS
jgi:signal transduction histidine kinase